MSYMLGERKIFRLNIYDESEAENLFIVGKDKLWVEIHFKKTIKKILLQNKNASKFYESSKKKECVHIWILKWAIQLF